METLIITPSLFAFKFAVFLAPGAEIAFVLPIRPAAVRHGAASGAVGVAAAVLAFAEVLGGWKFGECAIRVGDGGECFKD